MAADQLAERLGVRDPEVRLILDRRLGAMRRDGQLIRNRRGRFGLVQKMDLRSGRVQAHPDGFGFFIPDEGGKDLFLSPRELRGVLHGDRVVARADGRTDRRGRPIGTLVEVIERVNQTVVGRFQQGEKMACVVPDNRRLYQDILIPPGSQNGARDGQFVVARLTRQPDRHVQQPMGEIIECIGDVMNADMAVDIAIRAYQLPFTWPADVLEEADNVASGVTGAELRASGREDLQALDFVTIDGEDARDFDDAVYCKRRSGGGWQLYVAIADVAHYVRPGSALDREAWQRSTSVYFPRRVLPMLPERLSNDLCSLRPDEPRLALACIMDIGARGGIRSSRFCRVVIRSRARLSYTEVAAVVVDKQAKARARRSDLLPLLDDLYALFQIMHRRRARQGLLEFSSVETRMEFDAQGQVQSLQPLVRNDAHRLIEEFMLAANTAAGQYLEKAEIPALYRVHPPPEEERLQAVRDFLREFALQLGGSEQPTTSDYAELLDAVRGREDAHLIETVLLRSMALAVYSDENTGHFGLGFPVYSHFTSPIRRYPDLLVHRAIRHRLAKGKDRAGEFAGDPAFMQEAGGHCSTLERRAEEATRDAVQRMKCLYLQARVGEDFDGRISTVTSFGLFVELNVLFVEGLIHISTLPQDYYHFDPIAHSLSGERSKVRFRLGDALRVKVARVDVDEKKIDFELLSTPGKARRARRAPARRSRRRRG